MPRPSSTSKTATTKSNSERYATSIDDWLFREPELDDAGLALLTAYHNATTMPAGESSPKPAAPTESDANTGTEDAAIADEGDARRRKPVPGVPRLDVVEGVPADRFSGLHGHLLAVGYLTAEVVGRTDGLSYRVTREGLTRLTNETSFDASV